jgi:hypothetical protein
MSSERRQETEEEFTWNPTFFPSDTATGNQNYEDVTWATGLDGFETMNTTTDATSGAFDLLQELELDSEDGVYERDESYDPQYELFSESFAALSDEEPKVEKDIFASDFQSSSLPTNHPSKNEYHVDRTADYCTQDETTFDTLNDSNEHTAKKIGVLGTLGVAAVFAQQIMSRLAQEEMNVDESDITNVEQMPPPTSSSGQHLSFFDPSSSTTTTKAAVVGGSGGGDGGGTITTVIMMNPSSSTTATATATSTATTASTSTATTTTTTATGTSATAGLASTTTNSAALTTSATTTTTTTTTASATATAVTKTTTHTTM